MGYKDAVVNMSIWECSKGTIVGLTTKIPGKVFFCNQGVITESDHVPALNFKGCLFCKAKKALPVPPPPGVNNFPCPVPVTPLKISDCSGNVKAEGAAVAHKKSELTCIFGGGKFKCKFPGQFIVKVKA